MKAVKKPIPIEVVRFDGGTASIPDGVSYSNNPLEFGGWAIFNRARADWLPLKVGDYLNVTDLNDVYPISAEYFAAHYEVIEA